MVEQHNKQYKIHTWAKLEPKHAYVQIEFLLMSQLPAKFNLHSKPLSIDETVKNCNKILPPS